jgi:guanine deaminase
MADIELAVVGRMFHAPTPFELEMIDGVVAVGPGGVIIDVIRGSESPVALELVARARKVWRLSATERLLPGLVDTHVHAPQWPQLGTGLDLPLENWLFDHTFPLEARYSDAGFARDVWEHMVPTLLGLGTTTAVYYSSIHEEATRLLAERCVNSGQRALVGRVAMDHPEGTPDWYRDGSAGVALERSRRSATEVAAIGSSSGLVKPILTPRFIPACSDELLAGMGRLADELGVPVQTHCSESDWEHSHVRDRFGRSDTEMLDEFGLLRDRTVLAHGNLVSRSDAELIRHRGAGIAHCPLSNSYFANCVLPLRELLDSGTRVGLGSDVAGGAWPGLLSQCAHAVTVSRMLEDGVDGSIDPERRGSPNARIDSVQAFHVATAGGAELVGLDAGAFLPGRRFDAFAVDVSMSTNGMRAWTDIDDEVRIFEKIVRLAGAETITSVWVDGRLRSGRAEIT